MTKTDLLSLMTVTASRNDLITQWTLPYTDNNYMKTTSPSPTVDDYSNFDEFIHIYDDEQLPSELFNDSQQSTHPFYPAQRPLESPTPSLVALNFASPASSTASESPVFSSPAFWTAKSPTTSTTTQVSHDFDGGSWVEAPSMSTPSSRQPSIHVQQSSPRSHPARPYSAQALSTRSPMLAQHGHAATHGWSSSDASAQLLGPVGAQSRLRRKNGLHATHRRAQSGSPGTSAGPRSPLTHDQISGVDAYQPHHANGKSLPTPVHTPVQNSFLAASFQNYELPSQTGDDNREVERVMHQAAFEQQQQPLPHQTDDDAFNYSLAPSVSSMSHQNSPATPQTSYEDLDDGSKAMAHGEDRSSLQAADRWMDEYLLPDVVSDFNTHNAAPNAVSVGLPKLSIYQDDLFNAGIVPSMAARKQQQHNLASALMSPYRNLVAERLQAANHGHLSGGSSSPSNTISRDRSAFRQGSELASDLRSALAVSNLPTNMQLSQTGMDLNAPLDNQAEPKTISPKDALLEYHETAEDVAMPSLFPATSSSRSSYQMAGETLNLRRDGSHSSNSTYHPAQNYSQMESFPNQYIHQSASLRQPFYIPPAQPPMVTHLSPGQQPTAQNQLVHQTADFPASLPSMGSTGSTATATGNTKDQIRRPSDTSSDSGTYTCTYHGCTLRFETPSKLQKHKREAHRQTIPGHLTGRDAANSSLAMRNSQAGPHKCERINPSTGKPCNSIFSRPYDLTRHEDTIHNARKQKVRCHLCQEEKTFSRNDALTRHMRVVHPEVDWPGKQRRKGRD